MGTRKIVINTCYGGFGLSPEAIELYQRKSGQSVNHSRDIPRDDPHLVSTVEELDIYAHGEFSELKIVEIPEDVQWVIAEYDGSEWVCEAHRVWR